ncbi:hypothetical protein EMPS_10142 [Entomortierella parvispora]|uniref:Carboxylesterase type B domain-containing protein n=1 Tax=Entomortierella parvispora TaxID=205924 RepID=A0A9P3M0Z2_9FUNG|nr:hypothetical protein EMPS_10142 [Entomortierella parvispora]
MMFRKLVTVVVATILASQALLTGAAPVKRVGKRFLLPGAPLSSAIDGVHLLFNNDVDSASSNDHAFILLSHPRSYYDGMNDCVSVGDGGFMFISGTSSASELVSLLNHNAPAQPEVDAHTQFWVYNLVPGLFGNCLAVNKKTGTTESLACSTPLPSVCLNNVGRHRLLISNTLRQVRVNTPVGQIQGSRNRDSFRFLGIPYAEAPVGDLRFAAPVAKAPFTGTFDAIDYKAFCPQIGASSGVISAVVTDLINQATVSEDCLHLNVYTPSLKGAGEAPLPVLFFIHSSGFTNYSGSLIIFEPGNLVSRGGVVVVTFNYRLGMLGWMENINTWDRNTVPGNQAIRDQILALKWVQKNIASFGGDPDMVTIFGQSSGATSLRTFLSNPSTFDLYKRVAGESDPMDLPYMLPADAAKMTDAFMQHLGCGVTDLACARSKSTNDIVEAQQKSNAQFLAENKWVTFALIQRPVIDGELIPADFSQLVKTGKYNTKADIMWGANKDDAGMFIGLYAPDPIPIEKMLSTFEITLDASRAAAVINSSFYEPDPSDPDTVRKQWTKFATDYYFLCPLRYISREMVKFKPTYNFQFNHGRDLPVVGGKFCSMSTGRVCHGAELQDVFASGAVVPLFSQTGDDSRFARQVVDRWTTFAKTGNPNPKPGMPGLELLNPDVTSVDWVPTSRSSPTLDFNIESTLSYNQHNAACDWLDTVLLYDFMIKIPGNRPS